MTKFYKIPSYLFRNYFEFLKYKLGLSNLPEYEILQKILNLLKKRYGLLEIYEVDRYRSDLPTFFAFEGKGEVFNVCGVDFKSKNIACSKMIGEFLERKVFKEKVLSDFTTRLSMNDLSYLYGSKFVSDFHEYDKSVKEINILTKIDKDFKLETTMVEDLISNKKIFYPTQCIFYNKLDDTEPFRIGPRNSTGCAGGFDLESATISALFEVVERDSFLFHWLNKKNANKIVLDFEFGFMGKINELQKYGFSVDFFDITTTLGIPTVLGVLKDKKSGILKSSISAATSKTFSHAIERVLLELYMILKVYTNESLWEEVYQKVKDNKVTEYIGSKERAVLLYRENAKEIDFIESGKTVKYTDLENRNMFKNFDFNEILNIFKIKKFHVYRYVSSEDFLKDIGYKVVRIIVPELIPFYMEEKLSMKISERLGENPALNSFPHPFP